MDIKLQVNRGSRDPMDWDQRKSEGEFQGAADDVHVKTIGEFRTEDDLFINPDRLQEFIQPGDNLVMVMNRALTHVAEQQPDAFEYLAVAAGLGGQGRLDLDFLVYDND